MKRYTRWYPSLSCLLLTLIALSLQSCFGIGGNFKTVNSNGQQIQINQDSQAVFSGKIYFTLARNLYVLDGALNVHQLTQGKDIRDPAVSPDGKWIAFDIRYKDYSDLAYMSTSGGAIHTLVTGKGHYFNNSAGFLQSDYYWFAQPSWSADSSHLLFLSNLQKLYVWANQGLGNDFDQTPFLDLQIFSLPINTPTLSPKAAISKAQIVAYADYGDGGDRDPAYRPGHSDQIVYTRYTYDQSRTQQLIQIMLQDPNTIADHPELHYHPGDPGESFNPGIAITPAQAQNIQPAFSPTGDAIAYVRRENSNSMGLYVMPAPGENVTTAPESSTMQRNALSSYNKSSQIQLQQLISEPTWSPDERQIAYISYTNNQFGIWLATLARNAKKGTYSLQGSPIQLTSGGIDGDSRPCWHA